VAPRGVEGEKLYFLQLPSIKLMRRDEAPETRDSSSLRKQRSTKSLPPNETNRMRRRHSLFGVPGVAITENPGWTSEPRSTNWYSPRAGVLTDSP